MEPTKKWITKHHEQDDQQFAVRINGPVAFLEGRNQAFMGLGFDGRNVEKAFKEGRYKIGSGIQGEHDKVAVNRYQDAAQRRAGDIGETRNELRFGVGFGQLGLGHDHGDHGRDGRVEKGRIEAQEHLGDQDKAESQGALKVEEGHDGYDDPAQDVREDDGRPCGPPGPRRPRKRARPPRGAACRQRAPPPIRAADPVVSSTMKDRASM